KRPQTPKPPYPYHSEDVEYTNADKSITYGATVTYPETVADPRIRIKAPHYPAIILITGSGPQDRDETIFGHKSFAVIADYLTKKGFLVLRVDDRGIGKTTGNFATSTTADFAKDVEAGIDYLKTRVEIDKDNIGLIGHSEGGMIAPMVATERKEIKFIVLLAGPGIPIIDLMTEQAEAVSASNGTLPATVKAAGELYRIAVLEINKTTDKELMKKNIGIKMTEWSKTADTSLLRELGFSDTAMLTKNIALQVNALSFPWFKYFLAFNPQVYLQKLSCKVLALNGSKDVQVIAASNLAGIKSSLKKSKSPQYDVIELAELNHLFQTCIKCSPDEYGELEESFSPKALQVMGDWLQKNVK
ncbi:MAG: alpha/beta fold hydrolase, partial [Ferruginibacter sp.]